MRRLTRLSLFVVTLCSSLSFAQPYKKLVSQAADLLEQAETTARNARGSCRRNVAPGLDAATDHVYDLRKNRGDVQSVKLELSAVASNASLSGCPSQVLENIQQSIEVLEDVRSAMWKEHQGRRNDWDDDEPTQPGKPLPVVNQFVQLATLNVQTNASFENEPAVRVAVPELRMTNMQGRNFYLGARFRSYEGHWSEWVTTQQWSVPSDPFVWKNAFQHFFRFSTLAEDDFSDGRFVASVAVFDAASGQVLATREVTFRTKLPQLPPGPVIPVPDQRPPIINRDCGTGNDPGCMMMRDNVYAMDGQTFVGVMQSLRANPNETLRAQLVQTVFQRNSATALQFGMMLDLFQNEMLRLGAAQAGARRVVNPQHALGFASKWSNSTLQAQYTQIMLAQGTPGTQVPPQQYPPNPGQYPPGPGPGQYPPPQYPPQMPVRDCGTGDDPDCSVARGGRLPMDAQTFQGVVSALRSTMNELTREEMCGTMLANNTLTSMQLGVILDLFNNEITKLDVGKRAVTHLVNPQHGLGLATKFRNSLLGQELTQAIMQQH